MLAEMWGVSLCYCTLRILARALLCPQILDGRNAEMLFEFAAEIADIGVARKSGGIGNGVQTRADQFSCVGQPKLVDVFAGGGAVDAFEQLSEIVLADAATCGDLGNAEILAGVAIVNEFQCGGEDRGGGGRGIFGMKFGLKKGENIVKQRFAFHMIGGAFAFPKIDGLTETG